MDKALKQRLVGASVLIILAVIVLPMLLSGRSDRLKQETSQIELPPKPEELSIETRRFPVGTPTPADRQEQTTTQKNETASPPVSGSSDPAVETGKPAATVSGDPSDAASSPVEVTPEPLPAGAETQMADMSPDEAATTADSSVPEKPRVENVESPQQVAAVELETKPKSSLELTSTKDVPGDTPRYLVQVASFSNEKNANALADVLKKDKLPVLMDVVDRSAGRMYRVRVGPYAKRAEADALVSSLGAQMSDLTPRVLDLRPDDSAPVSAPSDPLVRWVVQVGSFGNPESAEDLVARLRLNGFSAFSEKVTAAGGTVYKVRIGPELDRDKAVDMASKLKSEQGLDAFVTTQQ